MPSLSSTDPCFNLSKRYIPDNAVKRVDLPDIDYSLIAHAPWISENCTKSYLASASQYGARAFFFFDPDYSQDQPPTPNDPFWGLSDGGQWKSQNQYPVYAMSGFYGQQILQQLALYSGNMTDVPNGHILTETYDPHDYVRLYTTVDTGHAPTLPNLWVFLLIVLGLLLTVIFVTSFLMHYLQRRRRQELRRMIASGEVDLEALGIKRVKVPQELINAMPLFVYVASGTDNVIPENAQVPQSMAITSVSNNNAFFDRAGMSKNASSATNRAPAKDSEITQNAGIFSSQQLPHRQVVFSQESCPICLDEFISHETVVRQLPCVHVYHPDCIDPFLRENSSLCPICKGKVLPKGYCPTDVTNAMVRRERLIRRMRERVANDDADNDTNLVSARPVAMGRRMASFHRQFGRATRDGRRISSAPAASSMEMRQTMGVTSESPGSPSPAAFSARSAVVSRTEWARRRASILLGHERMAEDEDLEREARTPRCK